jgi:copine 5/8/9
LIWNLSLEFYKLREDGSWQKTHSTEVVKNNLNPVWKEIVLPTQVLCNSDKSRPMKIKCFDWDSDGSTVSLKF